MARLYICTFTQREILQRGTCLKRERERSSFRYPLKKEAVVNVVLHSIRKSFKDVNAQFIYTSTELYECLQKLLK